MKQGLYSNEWISTEIQSAEINPQAYREEVCLIVSLKTLFENLHLVKVTIRQIRLILYFVYGKKCRWGLTSLGQYTLVDSNSIAN